MDSLAPFTILSLYEHKEYSTEELYTVIEKISGHIRQSEKFRSVNFTSRETLFSKEINHPNLVLLPEEEVTLKKVGNEYSYDPAEFSERNVEIALLPINLAHFDKLNEGVVETFSFLTPLKNGRINSNEISSESVTDHIFLARSGNGGGLYYYRDTRLPGLVLTSTNHRIPEEELVPLFLIANDQAMLSDSEKIIEVKKLLKKKYFHIIVVRFFRGN
jgi:hypothetical protein